MQIEQSKDENTIVLDNGKQLKAEPADVCEGCYFDPYPHEVYCLRINCQASVRIDEQDVIFREVE